MKKTKKRGFTIVELVIVIAVIAILAAVLIPTFTGVINASKESSALQESRAAWMDYVATYAVENNGALPTGDGVITCGEYTFETNGATFEGKAAEGATGTAYTCTNGVITTGSEGE